MKSESCTWIQIKAQERFERTQNRKFWSWSRKAGGRSQSPTCKFLLQRLRPARVEALISDAVVLVWEV